MSALALAPAFQVSASAAVLGGVAAGRLAAAIWRRGLPEALAGELGTVSGFPPFRHRVAVDVTAPALAVEAVLEPFGGPSALPVLAKDLRQLLSLAAVAGFAPRHLRLEQIDDDGCRLFHADRVAARLLCTYAGDGTELLPDAAADRSLMGQGDNRHVRDASAIVRVPAGAVLLMRGDLSGCGPGVLHRSPPNPGRTPRVLAAVDA